MNNRQKSLFEIMLISLLIAVFLALVIQNKASAQTLECHTVSAAEVVGDSTVFYAEKAIYSTFTINGDKLTFYDSLINESWNYDLTRYTDTTSPKGRFRRWVAFGDPEMGYFDFIIDERDPKTAPYVVSLYFSELTFVYLCRDSEIKHP